MNFKKLKQEEIDCLKESLDKLLSVKENIEKKVKVSRTRNIICTYIQDSIYQIKRDLFCDEKYHK